MYAGMFARDTSPPEWARGLALACAQGGSIAGRRTLKGPEKITCMSRDSPTEPQGLLASLGEKIFFLRFLTFQIF